MSWKARRRAAQPGGKAQTRLRLEVGRSAAEAAARLPDGQRLIRWRLWLPEGCDGAEDGGAEPVQHVALMDLSLPAALDARRARERDEESAGGVQPVIVWRAVVGVDAERLVRLRVGGR